ncbi:MAG: 2'-5' RNA ligase family protein [Terriglobales bacterium]
MANESAIIVPFPEVELIVGPMRLQYDRAAQLGVPAHITLLYPFCPPQAVAGVIPTLRDVCAAIEAFQFSFTELRRFPATAYLHPDKAERFECMIRTLVKTWPDFKPYGGSFSDIIPHLTVADKVDDQTLNAVEDSLRHQLPIKCVTREVWLLTSDDAGMWSRRAAFPLAPARTAEQTVRT